MGNRSPNAQRLVPCMPPLMEEETKPLSRENGFTNFGGTACENIVKAYFLSQSINIAEPHVDNGVDLLIEKPEGWVRGQVKKVVYKLDMDHGIFKRTGKKVYRSRFDFNFQGGGKTAPHLKNGRSQKCPKDYDYFYHVLLTPYRQLIWETPVNLIPLREDGNFIFGKNPCLDRDNWKRKPADIDFRKLLVYSRYDPIIFKTYPDFFLKPEQTTLDNFFDDGV
tara:strand:- start:1215 stop:1880 length:666 start_codon:yes stop_codon:yes gene_type:complete